MALTDKVHLHVHVAAKHDLNPGFSTLNNELNPGLSSLNPGLSILNPGLPTFNPGLSTLNLGFSTLNSGLSTSYHNAWIVSSLTCKNVVCGYRMQVLGL